MLLRRNTGRESPHFYVSDSITEASFVTMKIYHGEIMKRIPEKHYVGGNIDYIDYVNAAKLNIAEFKKMAEICGYFRDSITFWRKCERPGSRWKLISKDFEASAVDDVLVDTHEKRNQSILEERELLSDEIKRKMVDIEEDSDCVDSEDVQSLDSDSETESFNFPKFNPKTDGDNPVLAGVGILLFFEAAAGIVLLFLKLVLESDCYFCRKMIQFCLMRKNNTEPNEYTVSGALSSFDG
ncbi:hypothetical protein A4A49_23319 [Nicotiana attenuata]|uniref:PB1-like domain-containing protein n=1 Tax=Nicotiana attenuata TaxID=49451 RepID=A0A314L0R8_NICAT|nr:hypothetical protein A4A49_23319 [Nicotiana attenuata]